MALIAMEIMVQAHRYIEVLALLLLFCSLLVCRLANVGPCSCIKAVTYRLMKAGAYRL